MGTFNVDPERGEGRRDGAAGAAATTPLLQDPEPVRGRRHRHGGLDRGRPGRLRVDYILPSRMLSTSRGSGVLWPGEEPQLGVTAETAAAASDHRLVWVDLAF
jgi:endonuclease/exonuclease/phosphatase family metal-dependent hydrolase